MIYFPKGLTPVPKYPGYFWDIDGEVLYSIKIGGVLRPLKKRKIHPAVFSKMRYSGLKVGEEYYSLSKDGRSRIMLLRELKKLKLEDHEISKHG